MVKEEIFRLGDKFTEWLGSNEADETIKAFIENLAGMLARLADGLVSSEGALGLGRKGNAAVCA